MPRGKVAVPVNREEIRALYRSVGRIKAVARQLHVCDRRVAEIVADMVVERSRVGRRTAAVRTNVYKSNAAEAFAARQMARAARRAKWRCECGRIVTGQRCPCGACAAWAEEAA